MEDDGDQIMGGKGGKGTGYTLNLDGFGDVNEKVGKYY